MRASKRSRKRALVLIAVHLVAFAHILHWQLNGTSLAPLEPSEAHEAITYGVINAGFVLLALAVVSTLFLGRWFCGWACHVVALQDLCAWMMGKLGIRPRPIRSRLLVFVPIFAAIDVFLLPRILRWIDGQAWQGFSWHPTTDELWETFPGPWMAALTFLVDGFLIVYLLGGKAFCTYGCPYGALFALADRRAKGRIRVTDACEGCGHCTVTCTSNVDVRREVAQFGQVVDAGCMKCGDCISVCPKEALYFGFRAAPGVTPKDRPAPKRPVDFTWPEEIGMAVVFAISVYAFRGLYGGVPFLLAVGLAVIAALGTIVGLRLVRQGELSLQHHRLKTDGRLTGAGFAALALVPAFLAFTAHSAWIQFHWRRGVAAMQVIEEHARGTPERIEAVVLALDRLGVVDRWGLRDSAELHNRMGQLAIELSQLRYESLPERTASEEYRRAEAHLRRAIELDDGLITARLRWAEVLILAQREEESLDLLEQIFEREPLHGFASQRLGMILERRPGLARARLMGVDFALRLGDVDGAANALAPLLQSQPADPEVQARRRAIEAARP